MPKTNLNAAEFTPGLHHPYYIIRTLLYKSIEKHAGYLNGKILDLGCGSKPYQSLFNYSEYIGVDFENPGHAHDQEQIDVFYDGKKLPFANATFDSALSTEVFEHVFNLPELIEELHRVLKNDAHVLITCPFVWKEHELPHDYARYTLYALDELMTAKGFSKVIAEKSGNFSDVICQLWILFFYDKFYKRIQKIMPLRMLFKLLFILIPNLIHVLFRRLASKDDQMYLNNIIVYRKANAE